MKASSSTQDSTPRKGLFQISSTSRKSEYPFLADWFAITLRWLVLVGLAMIWGMRSSISWVTITTGLVVILWNLVMTVLASANRRLPLHRFVNILIDTIFSVVLLILGPGDIQSIIAAGMLGIVSAGVYFEWHGSLIIALLLGLIRGGWIFANGDQSNLLFTIAIPDLAFLFSGSLIGLGSMYMMNGVRRIYRGRITQRNEAERKVQALERSRMQTFFSMVETLSATLNYQSVLETALDLCTAALSEDSSATQLVSAVLLFEDQDLIIASSRRLPPRDLRQKFAAAQGALASAVQKAEPQRLKNPSEDPELSQLVILQSCRSGLIMPLNRGINSYGVMVFAHPDADFFSAENSDLLGMISQQSVIAIQNARLFQEIEEEKKRIIETQEEARKQLARDLHDGPTQSVSSIAMRINIARKFLERDPSKVEEELIGAEDLARRTTQEIRHMLFTLRPLVLESEGLSAALTTMAEKMRETYSQNVVIDIDPQVIEQLELGKQSVIFSIAEEAVNNARKHAHASEIRVSLKFFPNDRSLAGLEIADEGVGFDVESVTNKYDRLGSLGMVNLRERTDLLSGVLRILSAPGKGTRIRVLIPLTQEAVDRLQRSNQSS